MHALYALNLTRSKKKAKRVDIEFDKGKATVLPVDQITGVIELASLIRVYSAATASTGTRSVLRS